METDENGQVKWVTKIFGIETLERIVLHYCDDVICPRKTNKQGGTTCTENFNPHLHDIDNSMSFVYIAYGQIVNHNVHPVVFGEYQASSGTTQEADFVDGPWLKVVCGYSSRRRNFSIITSFSSTRGPEASDIPKRVVGSLAKATDIIFADKSCRRVKLEQAIEADLAAEVHKRQWPPVMSICLTSHNWDQFQKMDVVNPIFKQYIMVTLLVTLLSSMGAYISTMSSLQN